MTVYSIEPLTKDQVAHIRNFTECGVTYINRACFGEYADLYEKIEILICRDRDEVERILALCPNLKFIYIVSAGVEKLPFKSLLERNVVVANAGGINAEIMSQYAMAYILSHSARVCENLDNQRKRYWKKFQCVDDLTGQTLLIVGAGRVGSRLAKKAKAFGMRIVGIKNHVSSLMDFNKIVSLSELDVVLPEADYVVCALPLTPKTQGLFNLNRFAIMKNTSTFINISRGGLVDETALVEALQKGWLKSAVLDVFDAEPVAPESPLWSCNGLYVTPHSAGRLERFMDAAIDQFVVNMKAFTEGRDIPNKVSLSNGY